MKSNHIIYALLMVPNLGSCVHEVSKHGMLNEKHEAQKNYKTHSTEEANIEEYISNFWKSDFLKELKIKKNENYITKVEDIFRKTSFMQLYKLLYEDKKDGVSNKMRVIFSAKKEVDPFIEFLAMSIEEQNAFIDFYLKKSEEILAEKKAVGYQTSISNAIGLVALRLQKGTYADLPPVVHKLI